MIFLGCFCNGFQPLWLTCSRWCLLLWIDTLHAFPDKYRGLWLVFETTNQMSGVRIQPCHRHVTVGTDCSLWMFKSVLSQQVNGFIFYTWISAVYLLLVPSFFPFLSLFSLLWACLEITHNAQPHKLTGSRMGHGVIRWRQYHSVFSQYQDRASRLLWSHASAFPRVLSTRLHHTEKMSATCWYLTPPPFLGVCVPHLLLLKHAYRYCFQVLQRDIYRIL